MTKILTVIILSAFVYGCVQALECYTCNNCTSASGATRTCQTTDQQCGLWSFKNNATNVTRLFQDCVYPNHCNTLITPTNHTRQSCRTCSSERCNPAPGLFSNFGLVAMAAIAALYAVRR